VNPMALVQHREQTSFVGSSTGVLAEQAVRPRRRALLVGTLLMIPNAAWIVQIERVREGPYPTTISLFLNAIFWLILLLVANRLLRGFRPALAFRPAELLLIYSMLCIGSAFVGLDGVPALIQMMAHPYYHGAQQAGFERVLEVLPPALVVQDSEALRGYFIGNDTLYRWDYLKAWLSPLLLWLVFIGLLWWTMLCLSSLVRYQWTVQEKLAFPLVALPLQMVQPEGGLWCARLFWAGALVAGGINLLNGLHFWFPSVPEIPVKHQDLAQYMTNKPWDAVGWFPVSFYPFAIGIGYLLPLDLLFSCWFFYLFWKAQLVVSRAWGLDITPEFPYIREQGIGAYLAIGLFLLLGGRGLVKQIVTHLRTPSRSDLRDDTEALPYRHAVWGLFGGLAGLTLFLGAFGMRWHYALLAVALYLLFALVITRIRAELGPPVHDQHFSGPDHVLTTTLGTHQWSRHELTMLNFFYWFNRAYRSHPMPFILEGFKMAHDQRAALTPFFKAFLWAGLWGAVLSFWAFLHYAYRYGTGAEFFAGQQFGFEAYNRLQNWVQLGQEPHQGKVAAMGVGFVVASGLMMLRTHWLGFPLHPIGFAISGSWAMNLVWAPLMLAWLIKWLIVRFGGLQLYRQWLPFFLGLIVGEAVVGMGWSLVGVLFNTPAYSFWGQ